MWSKCPWRLSIGGMMIMAALALVGMVTGWDHSLEPKALCWAAAFLVTLIVTGVGAFSMRFELVGAANKTLQDAPGDSRPAGQLTGL